ncbi:hypothetical protein HF670_07930 [Acidithiobacillus thiooxidans]|uniref:hypothetical protein n=1 Tax=Acidithiobacillus TaxID=119977 RepID=UPI001C07E5CD|nr:MULTISPECIES: hypothetical protein [Acidithiobacillus]MBU2740870.1 hypothetical protein [Acidithiobacillus albertensis]MBU2839490.1 hypothetical protein [Acidithiobacillus thiooxidans]
MPHPNGGRGNTFPVAHSFRDAFAKLEAGDFYFKSNTGEKMTAKRGNTAVGHNAIVFHGENVMHGNICLACWGYRMNCTGTRIGHAVEAFDHAFSD